MLYCVIAIAAQSSITFYRVEIMKTNRIICVIITIALICSITACNTRSGENGGPGSESTSSPAPDKSENQSPAPTSSPNPGNSETSSPAPTSSPDPGGSETPSAEPSTAPGTGGGGQAGLSGTTEEILAKLVEDLQNAGAEMPMAFPPTAVPAGDSQFAIGLSETDFEKYVASAAQSLAAIGTFAHQIVLIEGVDTAAAGQIKKLVSSDGGYDAQKWICVFPEKVIAVESGAYVLLVASYREVADKAVEIFEATVGSIGEVVTFWDGV